MFETAAQAEADVQSQLTSWDHPHHKYGEKNLHSQTTLAQDVTLVEIYPVLHTQRSGQLSWYSAGLVINRFQAWVPGAVGEFSSPELSFYTDSFGVYSTPVLVQWHVKDPGHCAKSAGGRLHLNTYMPLTQRSKNGLTMLSETKHWNLLGKTSSDATHQRTLGHSHLNLLSYCGLILALIVEFVSMS